MWYYGRLPIFETEFKSQQPHQMKIKYITPLDGVKYGYNKMKNKEYDLTITVSGRPSKGKTTVAQIINDALLIAGMPAEIEDDGFSPNEKIAPFNFRVDQLRKKNLKVLIKTFQTRRKLSE